MFMVTINMIHGKYLFGIYPDLLPTASPGAARRGVDTRD
jgi:hypothetical protein